MSLLHALVARGNVVLAEHDAANSGNKYAQATQTILSKIPPNDSKLTYAAGDLLIHYIKSRDLVVLVVAEDAAGRRMPFSFLAELMKRFNSQYSSDEVEDVPAYGMMSYSKDIAQLMKQYEESPPNDPIQVAQAELAGAKDVMVKNIDAVLNRGERLDLLIDKTDQMSSQAKAFRRRATLIKRKQWWRNVRVLIIMGFSGVLLIYILAAFFCGPSLHCYA